LWKPCEENKNAGNLFALLHKRPATTHQIFHSLRDHRKRKQRVAIEEKHAYAQKRDRTTITTRDIKIRKENKLQ